MLLTNEQLRTLLCGACNVYETDGWIGAYHFTDAQIESFKKDEFYYIRAHHSAGITLRFRTDAKTLAFDYKLTSRCSADSIDVFADDVPVSMTLLKDMPDDGHIECALPDGDKCVTVYYPLDSQMLVKNLDLDGAWKSARPRTKVLWIGDSITQGYGPLLSGYSYVNIANRRLHWDVTVQGIGGLRYDDRFLTPIEGYKPHKIIVSLGTNGCGAADNIPRAEAFFASLAKLYPGIPTLVITPIWREVGWERILSDNPGVLAICAKYPNIQVVDGFTLVPHTLPMFLDGLHPNTLGCTYYGENLAREIRRRKF